MTQYIDKTALVAEIDSCIRSLEACLSGKMPIEASVNAKEKCKGKLAAYKNILSFIDTLEVKEVDLDEEIERCLKRHNMLAVGKKDFTEIAKHFFELGLTQKGE